MPEWPPPAIVQYEFCHDLQTAIREAVERLDYKSFPTGSIPVHLAKRVMEAATLSEEERNKLLLKMGRDAWDEYWRNRNAG